MTSSFGDIKKQLAKVKPWVGVAVVIGVALLGYYGLLGMNYLKASAEVSTLEEEIRTASASLRVPEPDIEALENERDLQEDRLGAVRGLSTNLHSDDLVGILVATASETDVYLSRVGVGEVKSDELDEVRYDTQSMSLAIQGEITDMFQFLTSVQRKVPLTSVPTLNITSADEDSSAQVDMVFYMSPQTNSD